jgi:biopolymer transport protein ExbD
MRTQSGLGSSHDAAHGIDLAPMLDFVVNLLIFFIITAVFLKESAVTVRRPTSVDPGNEKPTQSIAVLANGDIVIGDKTVDVRAVRSHIERLRAVNEHAGLVIVAQARAPTGALISVIDEAHLGGIYDITFTTTE